MDPPKDHVHDRSTQGAVELCPPTQGSTGLSQRSLAESHLSPSDSIQVCCAVFGRDEAGASGSFEFTQQHVDQLLIKWADMVMGAAYSGTTTKPTADTIQVYTLDNAGAA